MKKRKKAQKHQSSVSLTWIFLLILLVFFGTCLFISKSASQSDKLDFNLPKLKEVNLIEFTKNQETILLQKENEQWNVQKNEQIYPADSERVMEIVDKFNEITRADQISLNAENQEKIYGFDEENKIDVNIKSTRREFSFFIGKNESFMKSYISVGDERTFAINQNLRMLFESEIDFYRLKKVISFDKEIINKIFIQNKEKNIMGQFTKEENVWKNADDEEESSINQYLEILLSSTVQKFLPFPADLKEYNLQEESLIGQVALKDTNDQKYVISISQKEEDFFMKLSGVDQEIFQISAHTKDQLIDNALFQKE